MSSSLTQKMSSLLTTGRMTESLWDHTSISDLSGKVYIVTGGSKGIGYGIISALLSHNPKKVFFVSSREGPAMEKLEALKVPRVDAEGNREGGPEMVEEKVEWVKCDLDDLKEVDRVSLELKERLSGEGGRLDGVCHCDLCSLIAL